MWCKLASGAVQRMLGLETRLQGCSHPRGERVPMAGMGQARGARGEAWVGPSRCAPSMRAA